ncbi:serine hydrolase domain-containing protein [Aquimarina litoralis]|uniref:serine hydrolase domain-containing protein n=1 Tax=Aquimarina litoralis TaxID=584605 RepID=UPI001C569DCF|nr:serine hydrolase domain-containing protein [Aquimarina litoralis]MBW1294358.1 serine hydrolase [Aquimarina litoralis]
MNTSSSIKSNCKIIYFIVVLLLVYFPCNSQNEETYLSKIESGLIPTVQIENDPVYHQLKDRMKHYGAVGFSLTTIKDFKIEATKGYGFCQKENAKSVIENSVFRVGSISKSITAMVILKLQDNGVLDLDTDIKTYLKTWKLPKSKYIKKTPVTLRTLLTHRSGLKKQQRVKLEDHGFIKGDKIYTLNEVLDGKSALQPITFTSKPGETFKYSNQGYNLIQKVIEDATGKLFQDVAKELVLEPFEMNNSTFETVYPDENNTAFCYAYKDEKVHKGLYRNIAQKCGGGLFSTSQDLAKFSIKVAKIVNGEDDFLSPELAKQIFSENDYGLGFDLIKKDSLFLFSHSGRVPGFYSFMAMDPKLGNGFVMLVNSDGVDDLFWEMLRSVANAYEYPLWKPKVITKIDIDLDDYKNYLGDYKADDDDSMIKLVVKNNQLYYQESDDEDVYEFPLVPISKNVFIDGIDGNKIEFKTDGDTVLGAMYDDKYSYAKIDK